jgi:hypothetical protein
VKLVVRVKRKVRLILRVIMKVQSGDRMEMAMRNEHGNGGENKIRLRVRVEVSM